MSTEQESVSMARRALLTEHERDALLDQESDDARYVAVSRVRKKIDEELTRDVEVLRHHDQKHDTDLLGRLREIACELEETDDIAESDSSKSEPDDDVETAETWEDTVSEEQEIDDLLDQSGGSETTAEEEEQTASDGFDRDRIAGLDYNRDLTEPRLDALLEFLKWVKDRPEGVKKGTFIEDFWNEEREAATGYNDESFWEAFAKFSMKRLDEFQKPNTRTYRYVGETNE